jgi:general secretion pathway protein A
VRARIRPLSRREVAAYLGFKLSRAGAPPGAVLSRAAIRRIAAASAGFPRRVNIIADNALMAGFGADRKPVGRAIVARALAALDDRPRRRVWALAGRLAMPAALLLAVVGWRALPFGAGADPADRALASPPAAVAAAAPPSIVAVADVAPAPAAPAAIAAAEIVPPAAPSPEMLEPAARQIVYRVQPGDSLMMILRSHALPADAPMLAQLRQINPALTDLDRVYAGQALLLPAATP